MDEDHQALFDKHSYLSVFTFKSLSWDENFDFETKNTMDRVLTKAQVSLWFFSGFFFFF